jgi:iron complex outermembrane receptor protein
MKRWVRRAGVALALAALASTQASAQSDPDPVAERRERIEVTGSRIVTSDVESASPIAIINAADIKSSGYASLELILNNFPQLVADQGTRISNGATGTSTANLRGLFAERTLVLVNGRRLLAGSPFLLVPDLNQIPVALVSRIEILTGGASAVHGSDAIAGVINIILRSDFQGVEGSVSHDFYNHRQQNDAMAGLVRQAGFAVPGDKSHDGASTAATMVLGGNFPDNRGNASVSFRYLGSDALLQSDRDYSACALTIAGRGTPAERPACGGSSTGYPGRFQDLATRRSWTVADASGGVRPWAPPGDIYNFAPWNYYQRPVERYGANAFVHYDVSASTRLYAELGFHDDQTVAQIAPSGIFGMASAIRWENPLLSEAWRSTLTFRDADGNRATGPGTTAGVVIQRRNVEGGGRQYELRHTSYREVVGAKGNLAGPWDYDAYYQTSKVVGLQRSTRDFSLSRTARSLDVVRDPVTGAPTCAAVLDGSDPACVPYDIWSLGNVTPEALAYLELPAIRQGWTAQTLFSAVTRADLGIYGVRTPWARDSVEVALGFERRTDKLSLEADAAFSSGDLAGSGGSDPPASGGVGVKELFGEVRVPVLDTLAVTGSYRHSRYDTGVKADTFGVGFNAVPFDALRLRGSFQRAVRAANISELYTPQVQGFWGLGQDEEDPCAGPTPPLSLETCRRTGVTEAQYGRIPLSVDALAYPAILGGNPDLVPETANTLTLGIAFTPTRDFSATIDYFDIRIDDFIFGGTPDVTFRRCLESGDPLVCSLIRRDPALGTLWIGPAHVIATNQNIGRVQTRGADFAFDYRIAMGLMVSAIGSYMHSYTRENYRGADAVQCAGVYTSDCFAPRPRWRHRMHATWQAFPDVDVTAAWRYIHSIESTEASYPDLGSVSYLDLAFAWVLDKRFTLRAGINNVLDRDPPLLADAGAGITNGNTFVQTYDALGRHFFVSLSARF